MTGGQEDKRTGGREEGRTGDECLASSIPQSAFTIHNSQFTIHNFPPFLPSSLPASGVVHVCYARLDPPAAFIAQMEQTLAADEWARLRRFHFADDARRYAVRRGILRHLLGRYLDIPPAEIVFAYGPQHKPALSEPQAKTNLRFNLSDSGEMAVYAFAVGQEIGVDIEAQRDFPDARQLAESFFSPVEAEWLRQQPPEEESTAFLRCWTCKEAVVKALGDGLMSPLQAFTVAHWQTPPRLLWPSAPPSDWSIHLLNPPAGYCAALAVSGGRGLGIGDWGVETGDWGLGTGDSPIPNP